MGGGRAASLHAEATRLVRGVELVGVGGRAPGTAGQLAESVGVPDLPLTELIRNSEALVVAVPPAEVDAVLSEIPFEKPTLVESPIGPEPPPGVDSAIAGRPATLTGANLLHAPIVAEGLRAIGAIDQVHHLNLRVRAPRPGARTGHGATATGVLFDPGARLLPVLLAAAGLPVAAVGATATLTADGIAEHVDLRLRLSDDRIVTASLTWTDGPTIADLEAAGERSVVALDLWPRPALEIDGQAVVDSVEDHPLNALGFVGQMERLAEIARGSAAPWPPAALGVDVLRIATSAIVADATGEFCHP